ncbi:sensor histidine kinase [Streptomyces acidiscabies]|uniref:sensor histidine kinase n=1 Tax=Streptomyces acidiscabies TaxID=42234 RepID=UPI000950F694|nr:HAMP domain-containing sensor histidine kinase [Streptomyces acidiscabies]
MGIPRAWAMRSLRVKLTLANVALLALGITAATAVSLMAMRHYLIDQIDSGLTKTRSSLESSRLTLRDVDSLTVLAFISDQVLPEAEREQATPDSVFAAVDAKGTALPLFGIQPTEAQKGIAKAVGPPAGLVRHSSPQDVDLHGAPYRATATRLRDGTYVLMATSTDGLHKGMAKALRADVTVGTLLLALLACLTLFNVRRRMRPLEDMVETSSAIAEGDLTRRVPSNCEATQEVEQLRLALNSMLHQVETAYRTRERSAAQLRSFVADASHELRTPLAAIRGYLQLYDKGMLREEEERRRAWDRMNAEVDRMGRLVDELLTLARLDQHPELRLRSVDVTRLVRDAAQDLRAQQPARPVTVDASGTLLLQADESGLRQILGNLVANVRTHTPADVPVHLSARRAGDRITLTVADKGPGLSAENASRVFDRFFRTGSAAGSGLGLAIVQRAVESHNGTISVRTAPGEGLTATVELPERPGCS